MFLVYSVFGGSLAAKRGVGLRAGQSTMHKSFVRHADIVSYHLGWKASFNGHVPNCSDMLTDNQSAGNLYQEDRVQVQDVEVNVYSWG